MRIVCISDTHDNHRHVQVPEGDVLVHAGDFTCHREPIIQRTVDFNNWLGTLPHTYKIIIAGNHDTLFEKSPYIARSLITNAIYLEDSGIEVEGLTFWGSPYTREWDNWAFNEAEDELQKHWDLMPKRVDILITHNPPHGVGDLYQGQHLGDRGLLIKNMELLPKLHVFGHIHPGYGRTNTYVNAALSDNLNNLVNKPIVVDL